jgi:hypothetical protein
MNKTLTALLLAAAIGAPIHAAPPLNPFAARVQAMSDMQRRAVLRGALVNSGQRCGRADLAVSRGPYRNLVMWSVRCVPGGDYGIFVGPDGSAQVRTCTDLATLKMPACGLPSAPPPPVARASKR